MQHRRRRSFRGIVSDRVRFWTAEWLIFARNGRKRCARERIRLLLRCREYCKPYFLRVFAGDVLIRIPSVRPLWTPSSASRHTALWLSEHRCNLNPSTKNAISVKTSCKSCNYFFFSHFVVQLVQLRSLKRAHTHTQTLTIAFANEIFFDEKNEEETKIVN